MSDTPAPDLLEAIEALRSITHYHDKPRIHEVYTVWNSALERIDALCGFDVDRDGRLTNRKEVFEKWASKK